jgi:hypothetical protein
MRIKDPTANEPTNCPHCGVSLLGGLIPQEQAEYFSGTHWKREIGVEISEIYDGIYYWYCPDCKGEWGGYRSLK